ncbi:MAG: M48 family metalloprotease [Rhodobacteraceae bacterium]|nr:M48 family metalloprotease [Paracoccaceae bacterium]
MQRFAIATALLIGATGSGLNAQNAASKQVVCDLSECREISIPATRYSDTNAFSVQQVWIVVDNILAVSGLLPNFQVVETNDVDNAAAIIIDGERYLAFNAEWMSQYDTDASTQWELYGVMAHEVGHHLQGHTITGTGSKPPTELEADEYAGFTLSALGASLTQSQSLWVTLDERGSVTHPPRHQRLAAVERGWLRRQRQVPGGVTPTPAAQTPEETVPALPVPFSATQECVPVNVASRGATMCMSSVLPPQGNNAYGPANTLDDDSQTAWVEAAGGNGIGEFVTFVFEQPRQLSTVSMRNGYAKSDRIFARNSRVKRLRISASNGARVGLMLQDSPDWQSSEILAQLGKVSWIKFEIEQVYPGSQYQDTAITEIRLD